MGSKEENKCFLAKEDCNSLLYNKSVGNIELESLSLSDLELMKYRTGVTDFASNFICLHHCSVYLNRYPYWQKFCCV